jgi:hypothetical protein
LASCAIGDDLLMAVDLLWNCLLADHVCC